MTTGNSNTRCVVAVANQHPNLVRGAHFRSAWCVEVAVLELIPLEDRSIDVNDEPQVPIDL
jgi:hypothetical protein